MKDTAGSHAPETSNEPDYRFTLANERTFLAWQRTSLGLLAASLASLHFLTESRDPAFAYGLAAGLGLLALATSLGGLVRWHRNDAAIRAGGPLSASSLLTLLALLLGLAGLATVVAVAAVTV